VLLQAHLHPPDGWLPRALGQKGGGGGPFASDRRGQERDGAAAE
jgi:hypothetical protein